MENNLIVIESFHDEKFKTIKLHCVEDQELSWKAKGIQNYFISRPPGWKICQNDLCRRSTDGPTSLYSGIKELIQKKYIYRVVKRNYKKQILQWGYLCFENPIEKNEVIEKIKSRDSEWEVYNARKEDIDEEKLYTENLKIDSPLLDNRAPLININTNNNHSNTDQNISFKVPLKEDISATVGSGSSSRKLNRPDRTKNPLPKKPMFKDAVKGINELFEQKSAHLNQSTNPIKAPEEISILIEHWVSLGFKAPDPIKAPKGYNKTIQNLKKLIAGKLFYGDHRKFGPEDIVSAMDKFSLIVFDPKYGPKQPVKDLLVKKSLKDFLYNSHSPGIKSWFLEVVDKEMEPNSNVTLEEDKYPNITNKLKSFYYDYAMAGIRVRLDDRGENHFRKASNTLGRFLEQKGYKFPTVAGVGELAELLCSAIRQFYGNNTSKVSPASFSSKFAVSNMIKYMNEKGYFTDGESNHHWETGF